MSGNLFVQTDGLRTFSQTHAGIAAGLSQLIGAAAPAVAGVETSHGPIASAVSGALGELLGARQATIQTTATSGTTISESLQKAAHLYEQGDQQGATTLRAAADAMEGANGANTPGGSSAPRSPAAGVAAASAPAAGAGGAGSQMVGQMLGQLGQVGQQVGQMAQVAGAPLQALAQPLQQLPQQVMQGVQQAGGELETPGDPQVPGQADPAALPRAERAEPAQTRPQSD